MVDLFRRQDPWRTCPLVKLGEIAPLGDSIPVLDAVAASTAPPLISAGVDRLQPQDGDCDVGAFEIVSDCPSGLSSA